MTDFAHPQWLLGLWLAAGVAALFALAAAARRGALSRLADRVMRPRLLEEQRSGARIAKAVLATGAAAAIVLALARPQGEVIEEPVTRAGRDAIFLVDTSRSMLAQDLAPSRLERARLLIRDTLSTLEGDRVALVAFAGSTVVKCPLTTDYAFFRLALEDLSTESAARGGTMLGDAIRTTLDTLVEDEARFKDLIILTDGEDHGSFPAEAAARAGEQGVRIITVGLGDPDGTPIPVEGDGGGTTLLRYQGQIVMSPLEEQTLQSVATASREGVYLPVRTGTIELDAVYRELVRRAQRRELEDAGEGRRAERFGVYLAVALALLTLEGLISERRRA